MKTPYNSDFSSKSPGSNTILWRYMDFVKYVSMLSSKSLFCSSTALFSDRFEGAAGLLEAKQEYVDNQLKDFKAISRIFSKMEPREIQSLVHYNANRLFPGKDGDVTEEEYLKEINEEFIIKQEQENLLRRKSTYINCWYESNYESMAMWQLYSKDNNNAIAIKTNYTRMIEAIGDVKSPIEIGKVNYIDYSNPPEHFNKSVHRDSSARFWYKSNHFAHENEVRIISQADVNSALDSPGILLPVDLSTLVEKVYVSPWSQPWLIDLVKEVSNKYGLEVEVKESDIAKQPYY
jgi:hypothetical protein